ncbi:hypothetical protein DXG01_001406 [Tephrocybe rancida]|nr:hypothetical protein DXG01_001406 [Tephrocybe rancida]
MPLINTSQPQDITVHSLLTAKIKTLAWWIEQANAAAKACGMAKNLMTKKGKAAELCKKLADYYSLDLEAIVPSAEKSTAQPGDSFVNPDLQNDIKELMDELRVIQGRDWNVQNPVCAPDDVLMETICTWIGAAKEGDIDALSHLLQIQGTISGALSSAGLTPETPNFELPQIIESGSPSSQTSAIQLLVSTPSIQNQDTIIKMGAGPKMPSPFFSSAGPSEGDVLSACTERIKALEQASGLEDVIDQVESGEVEKMRCGKPEWKRLKGTNNKWEHIYKQLITEFQGDKEQFYMFFTVEVKEKGNGKKQYFTLPPLVRTVMR